MASTNSCYTEISVTFFVDYVTLKSERNGNVIELMQPYFIFNFHRLTVNCLKILNHNEINCCELESNDVLFTNLKGFAPFY